MIVASTLRQRPAIVAWRLWPLLIEAGVPPAIPPVLLADTVCARDAETNVAVLFCTIDCGEPEYPGYDETVVADVELLIPVLVANEVVELLE